MKRIIILFVKTKINPPQSKDYSLYKCRFGAVPYTILQTHIVRNQEIDVFFPPQMSFLFERNFLYSWRLLIRIDSIPSWLLPFDIYIRLKMRHSLARFSRLREIAKYRDARYLHWWRDSIIFIIYVHRNQIHLTNKSKTCFLSFSRQYESHK